MTWKFNYVMEHMKIELIYSAENNVWNDLI